MPLLQPTFSLSPPGADQKTFYLYIFPFLDNIQQLSHNFFLKNTVTLSRYIVFLEHIKSHFLGWSVPRCHFYRPWNVSFKKESNFCLAFSFTKKRKRGSQNRHVLQAFLNPMYVNANILASWKPVARSLMVNFNFWSETTCTSKVFPRISHFPDKSKNCDEKIAQMGRIRGSYLRFAKSWKQRGRLDCQFWAKVQIFLISDKDKCKQQMLNK